MRHSIVLLLVAAGVAASLAGTSTASAAPSGLQATFVNIYSQCPIQPPTLVFCGDGNVAGFGAATSTASLAGPLVPIPGTDCVQIKAVRTIALADGSGSLTLFETGTKCPPSEAAGANAAGDPYTVAKTYTIVAGTGVFSGATGSGQDINRSAGNSQISLLSGTLTLP